MTDRPQAIMQLGQGPLRTINWINYGHPGCGKTALFGTAEKGLFLDCDSGGTDTAAVFGSSCEVAYVNDYKELSDIAEFMRDSKEAANYNWLFWDSITLFMDRTLIDDLTAAAHDANPRQPKDQASQREFLIAQNRIGMFVREFCDLPQNLGISAHIMAEEAPDTEGEFIYMPLIPGKRGAFSSKMCGYMNVVTYHGKTPKTGTQRLITERTAQYYAKDRFHALRTNGKPFIDNPTVPKIEAMVAEAKRKRASNGQDPDPSQRGRARRRTVKR